MKGFYVALCIMLFTLSVCMAEEQSGNARLSPDKIYLEYDLGLGLGMAVDCDTGRYWRTKGDFGFGVNMVYNASEHIRMRSGISGKAYYASRLVTHPYAYVMNMDVHLSTYSTQLLAMGEWVIPENEYNREVFFGIGAYGDIIHVAEARIWQHYLTHTTFEKVNLKDSFPAITPGVMVCVGAQLPVFRLEVRFTKDILTFDIPGNNTGKQRRSTIGLHFGFRP